MKPPREREAALQEAGGELSSCFPFSAHGLVGHETRAFSSCGSHLTLTPPQVCDALKVLTP